ncbi:TTK protein kinase [Allomyces macrogynus ATCC 38327]|uniref:TTK protein kinase n=1 Tax=Allomyces macrogynus (strain ATCC 38327) TaxID=578462 RepID=A0A0L0T1E3_ALLM3|nr:TTK protein kinase [Allomyces macrogynus ATCC 38327]|eukprot:KNE68547.1 TTK protein kinase [Allomyces macrogynus ATCC 38327]
MGSEWTDTRTGGLGQAQLLERLNEAKCDAVIKLIGYEVSSCRRYLYLVLELGDTDMAKVLKLASVKPLNLALVRYYWRMMVECVHSVHQHRVVHADLKPANFLLVKNQLKLIDFGIAKPMAPDTTKVFHDSQVGTLNYMAPEAVLGLDSDDSAKQKSMRLNRGTDVWSLGVILYQMLYGRTPFAHLTADQRMKRIPDPKFAIAFPRLRRGATPASAFLPTASGPSLSSLSPAELEPIGLAVQAVQVCLQREPAKRRSLARIAAAPAARPAEPIPASTGRSRPPAGLAHKAFPLIACVAPLSFLLSIDVQHRIADTVKQGTSAQRSLLFRPTDPPKATAHLLHHYAGIVVKKYAPLAATLLISVLTLASNVLPTAPRYPLVIASPGSPAINVAPIARRTIALFLERPVGPPPRRAPPRHTHPSPLVPLPGRHARDAPGVLISRTFTALAGRWCACDTATSHYSARCRFSATPAHHPLVRPRPSVPTTMYSTPQTTTAAGLPPFPFSQRVDSNTSSAMTHNPYFDGDDPTLAEMMAVAMAEGHGGTTNTPVPAPPPTTSWGSTMGFSAHGGTNQGSIDPDLSEFESLFAADYSTATPTSSSVLAHSLTLAPTAMLMAAATTAFPPSSATNHGLFHVDSAPWGSSTTTTTTTTPRHDPLLTSVALPPPASSRRCSFLVPSPHAALDAPLPGCWSSTGTATATTSGMPDKNPGAWADQYPLAPLALWDGRATSHVDVAPSPAALAASTTATVSDYSAWPTSAKMDDSRPLAPVPTLETAMFNHHQYPVHDEPMTDAPSSASTAHIAMTSPTDLAPSALDELAAAMAAVSTPATPGVTRQLSSLSLQSRPLASTVSSLSLDSMGASTDAPLARIASGGGGASSCGFLHDSGLNLGDTPTLAAVDPGMGVVGAGAAQDRLHARRAAGAPEPLRLIDVRDATRFQESPLPTPSMGLPDAATGPLSPAAPDSGFIPSATAMGMGVGNFALPLASQSPPPSSGHDSWWALSAASANAALAALAPPPPPTTMPGVC